MIFIDYFVKDFIIYIFDKHIYISKMSVCPRCSPKKKNTIKIKDLIPEFNYLNCYNCKKRFIWINFFSNKYFIQKKLLLKD